MSGPTERELLPDGTDLVEYFVVVLPNHEAAAALAPQLVRLEVQDAIRMLDVVMLSTDPGGVAEIIEIDSERSPTTFAVDLPLLGELLSRHDVELVALDLPPCSAALIVVAEDRWAESLSTAALAVGGAINAEVRVTPARVEAAVARVRQRERFEKHRDQRPTGSGQMFHPHAGGSIPP